MLFIVTRRILIADDSPVARAALRRSLEAQGLEVVEHDCAKSAQTANAEELSCAVLDLDLGDDLGIAVAKVFRGARVDLPIAFFTSASNPEWLAEAKAFGPVFQKPNHLHQAIDWASRYAETKSKS